MEENLFTRRVRSILLLLRRQGLILVINLSWTAIRHTVNATDAEITQRFRNTALYHALLHALAADRDHTKGFILEPAEARIVPTVAELRSRWPGMPDEEVEDLIRDYQWESMRLKEYALDDVVERVRELAERDWV